GELDPAVLVGGQVDDHVGGRRGLGGTRRRRRLRLRLHGGRGAARGQGGVTAVRGDQAVHAEPDDNEQHHGHDQAEARRAPLADLDRGGRLEDVGGPYRTQRLVFGVVLADQRLRVEADGGGDAADVAAGVEV